MNDLLEEFNVTMTGFRKTLLFLDILEMIALFCNCRTSLFCCGVQCLKLEIETKFRHLITDCTQDIIFLFVNI